VIAEFHYQQSYPLPTIQSDENEVFAKQIQLTKDVFQKIL